MKDIKDIFNEAHRWEILIILEHMIKSGFFDFIKEGKTQGEILKNFGYKEIRLMPIIDLLKKMDLIIEKNSKLFNSELSNTYFISSSNKFVGNYLSWKVDDISNWRANIGKVLKGELESVYPSEPLVNGREENGAPLQEIITVCGFLYPSKEFSELVSKIKLKGSLMDLGCGTGEWSFLIGEKFKGLKLIEVDYNPQNSEKRLKEVYPKLKNKVSFVKGDFFNIKLPESNIALISTNFMEYSDSEIVSLIKKLRNESKTKTLLIHEYVLDEDEFPYQYNAYCALATKKGRLRTKQEWKSLLKPFKQVLFKKLKFGTYAIIATDEKL